MWFIERRSLPYFTMSNSPSHAQIVDSSFIAGVRKPAQSHDRWAFDWESCTHVWPGSLVGSHTEF